MKKITPRITVLLVALGIIVAASPVRAALREYVFSGPTLSGRFIIEEVSSPGWLHTNFTGSPFIFSITFNGVTFVTNDFQLTVINDLDAIYDGYFLHAGEFETRIITWAEANPGPNSSSLPTPFINYWGQSETVMAYPTSAMNGGDFYDLTSLELVPFLEIARSSSGLSLRWPQESTNYVLEATAALGPSAVWNAVTNPISAIDGFRSINFQPVPSEQYFRLRRVLMNAQ